MWFVEATRAGLMRIAVDGETPEQAFELVKEQGRAPVDMKPATHESFLSTGRRSNVFVRADELARKFGNDVEVVLRALLKTWYEPRVAFEQRAGAERRFHNTALNAGGMGVPSFGRFRVVDDRRPGDAGPDPVWIAEDSLSGKGSCSAMRVAQSTGNGSLAGSREPISWLSSLCAS